MEVDFEIVSPLDNRYGKKDPNTGKWNGLVGMVIDGVSVTFFIIFSPISNVKITTNYPHKCKNYYFKFFTLFSKICSRNPRDIVNNLSY